MQSAVSSNWKPMEQGESALPVHFAQINQRDGFFLVAREPDAADWAGVEAIDAGAREDMARLPPGPGRRATWSSRCRRWPLAVFAAHAISSRPKPFDCLSRPMGEAREWVRSAPAFEGHSVEALAAGVQRYQEAGPGGRYRATSSL